MVLSSAVACDGSITSPAPSASSERTDITKLGPRSWQRSLSEFTSQETCGACHPTQVEDWKRSSHSHAMTDPVFQALVTRASEEDPSHRKFCQSCHSNIGTVAGRFDSEDSFEDYEPIVMEGVTCESCHRITSVFRTSNAGHVLDAEAPMQGSVRAGDRSPFHETERSDVLGTAEFCASCHDVQGGSGVILEQPYKEWSLAPAKDDGQLCIDCHMRPSSYGPSAERFDLPERPRRSHAFVGLGAVTWSEPDPHRGEEIRAEVEEQLQRSVSISLQGPQAVAPASRVTLEVVVQNHVSGHRFPTGSTFFRQLWLELSVLDADGQIIVERTGERASERRASAEEEALLLSARLFDAGGQLTHYPWQAAHIDSGALEPLEVRRVPVSFDVPAAARGPLEVRAALQLRTFPPALLRDLDLPSSTARRFQIGAARSSVDLAP